VYVDDILLTDSDSAELLETKEYLKHHFVTKVMGRPKYFLGIELHIKNIVYFFLNENLLDLLEESGLLGCKPASTPMETNLDLWFDDSHTLDDPGRYKRLIEKLIYLTVIRPDITFLIGVLSKFMHQPIEAHWSAALRILAYLKSCSGKGLVYKKHGYIQISEYSDSSYIGDRGDRKPTTGYCTFVGGNIVT